MTNVPEAGDRRPMGRVGDVRRWRSVAVAVALVVGSAGISTGCQGADCKAYGSIGLRIAVVDASNQRVCDAVVTARAGGYTETLASLPASFPDGCVYYGATDRKGNYTVTIAADGRTTTVTGLNVTPKDDCGHVNIVATTIPLDS